VSELPSRRRPAAGRRDDAVGTAIDASDRLE